jgi:hypothetical protein
MVDILTPDNGGAAPSVRYFVSGGANGSADRQPVQHDRMDFPEHQTR